MPKNSIIASFSFAFKGISLVFKERNFKIHVLAALIAILLGLVFNISSLEWMFVILSIGGVISLETINTAIETLVDKISPEYDKKAGIIKDLSAASVLLFSMASLAVGLIIFIPHLMALFRSF